MSWTGVWALLRQRESSRPCRPLLLRRPKVVFFGAQAEKPPFFFFRRRLVMVFGGQITFSPPPQKTISAPKNLFGPHKYFSARQFFFGRSQRITQPEIWAPALGPILTGGGRGGGNPEKKNALPPTKNGLKKKKSA